MISFVILSLVVLLLLSQLSPMSGFMLNNLLTISAIPSATLPSNSINLSNHESVSFLSAPTLLVSVSAIVPTLLRALPSPSVLLKSPALPLPPLPPLPLESFN